VVSCWNSNDGYDDDSPRYVNYSLPAPTWGGGDGQKTSHQQVDRDGKPFGPILPGLAPSATKFPKDFEPAVYLRTDHEEEAPLPWWGILVGALFVFGVTAVLVSIAWGKLA